MHKYLFNRGEGVKSSDVRILNEAFYFLENKSTIRRTADYFGVSKSLVHEHFSKGLKRINYKLYCLVQEQLDFNFAQKHIRGGMAIKIKSLRKMNKSLLKSSIAYKKCEK